MHLFPEKDMIEEVEEVLGQAIWNRFFHTPQVQSAAIKNQRTMGVKRFVIAFFTLRMYNLQRLKTSGPQGQAIWNRFFHTPHVQSAAVKNQRTMGVKRFEITFFTLLVYNLPRLKTSGPQGQAIWNRFLKYPH